jgi:hypothetical protein
MQSNEKLIEEIEQELLNIHEKEKKLHKLLAKVFTFV